MLERLLIAGSGGQGVLLIGRTLAAVALDDLPHVTFFPSYGIEVRGGTSNCQVVMSSDPIPSPVCEQFDSMMLMNEESAGRFLPRLVPGGLAVLNSSLCRPSDRPGAAAVAATDLANGLGDIRVANLVMLGAYLARRHILPAGAEERKIRDHLSARVGASMLELNIKALRAGMRS
jgi:2-oxoglutarate ferredoxin oxidoreductase subunit gamma